jgi:hypothetical protein
MESVLKKIIVMNHHGKIGKIGTGTIVFGTDIAKSSSALTLSKRIVI